VGPRCALRARRPARCRELPLSCLTSATGDSLYQKKIGAIIEAVGVARALLFVRVEVEMLYWAAIFFVLALVAAFFGFGGIAGTAIGIGKILFIGFLVLAVVSLVAGRFGGPRRTLT
jgi:uncharacterized membrane protein YtjA (UPF0391 family)